MKLNKEFFAKKAKQGQKDMLKKYGKAEYSRIKSEAGKKGAASRKAKKRIKELTYKK